MNNHTQLHTPVLVDKVVELLQPKQGESYLDLTAGYGGHARAVLAKTANYTGATLVDRDANAIAALADFKDQGATLTTMDFAAAAQNLAANGKTFDIILMDLGVSSPQLDRAERGFSFRYDTPLDMRMDQRQAFSAAEVVNGWTEQQLAEVFVKYGEVRPSLAKRAAREITKQRPISTTSQLAEIIRRQVRRYQKSHPATQFFQAIRIVVNDELNQLEATLELLPKLTHKGSRVGVISFHSLEDRIVKNYFKRESAAGLEAKFELITKKPISGEDYDGNNPRARNAKFRAVMRI